jgi:hypothetical protein
MIRAACLLVAFGLFVLAVAAQATRAAPALKDRPADLLYAPTRVGDTQVYEQRGRGRAVRSAHVVTGVEEKGGTFLVTIEREGRPGAWTELSVSGRGVVWRTRMAEKLDDPVPWLKLPAKPGGTWSYESKPGNFKRTYTAGPEEEVEVPAGRFRAVRVDEEFARGGERARHTFWHARRVGLVKAVLKTDDDEWTQVLVSFAAGDGSVTRPPSAGRK